jgi:hypothetical protein
MRKLYFATILILFTLNICAQKVPEESSSRINTYAGLSWKISKHWIDTLKKYNGGENWTVKKASEFLRNKQSPYWTVTKEAYQMDIPFGTGEGQQRYPGTLHRCDLSNNNLTGALADNPIYRWSDAGGYEHGIFSVLSEFYFSYNKLTSVIADFMHGYTAYQGTQFMAFDHNQITEFDISLHYGGGGDSHGAIRIWLNNNKLSAYNSEWGTYWHGDMLWFMRSSAKFFRIENNMFNFKEMKKLYNKVEERVNYKWTLGGVKRDPEFKFTYAPQLPQGTATTKTLAAGDNFSLSFELPDADNKYIWELNGKEIPLTEGKTFSADMSTARAGMYRCKVTNPALPELTIYSKAQMRFLDKPDNSAPTDFNINNNRALANSPQWTVIGQLDGEDPDSDKLYFRLVDFEGDNADFRIIDGNTLVSSTILFEWTYKTEYNVRIQAYDIYGGTYNKEITITKGDVTGAVPTAVKLNNLTIDEDKIGNVGDFKLSGVETSEFTFTLSDNVKDNRFFTVSGATLKTKIELNYEEQRYYTVRVTATKGDVSITKDFVVEAINVNDAPGGLIITSNKIEIGKQPGTLIGLLVATDDDPDDTVFEYSFAEGSSEEFIIRNGNQLQSKKEFIRSDINTYPIKVNVKDDQNAKSVFTLNIEVVDNADPTKAAVVLSNYIADENQLQKVGNLSVNQGGNYAYELISGENAEHNSWFEIEGRELRLIKKVNYETVKLLNIRVKAGTIETPIDVIVRNINEEPISIGLTKFRISDDAKVGDIVSKLIMKDEDADMGIFTIESSEYFKVENDDLILIKDADKAVYPVNISATDGQFTITHKFELLGRAANKRPNNIGLSNFIVMSDWTAGTEIAKVSVNDDNSDQDISITLKSGDDNDYFIIDNGTLKLNKDIGDHGNRFTITVIASDGEFDHEQDFDLYIPTNSQGTNIINIDDVTSARVYPNPVNGTLNVNLNNSYRGNVIFELYSLSGFKVSQSYLNKQSNDATGTIDTQNINSGVYILKVTQGTKQSTLQIIKR